MTIQFYFYKFFINLFLLVVKLSHKDYNVIESVDTLILVYI